MADWTAASGDAESAKGLKVTAGVIGLICGGLAFLTAIGEVWNHVYGRDIMPLGDVAADPSAAPTPAGVIAGSV